MQELSNPPVRNRRYSTEFLIGQHSLFLAAFWGSRFSIYTNSSPTLPVGVAVPFFMISWGIVFILFYHERPLFSPPLIRRWWFRAAGASALFTLIAEAIWLLGLMPPPTAGTQTGLGRARAGADESGLAQLRANGARLPPHPGAFGNDCVFNRTADSKGYPTCAFRRFRPPFGRRRTPCDGWPDSLARSETATIMTLSTEPLLSVENLKVYYPILGGASFAIKTRGSKSGG